MAVPSTSVWEVRASATGTANTNGGGFDPSNGASNTTDYSQQDNAQYGSTDLATSNGTNATPTVTASSHSFVTADVGNFIRIVSGGTFIAGWYCINSVAAGGAVLDRACASGASTSGGTYNVGGAISLGAASDSTMASTVQAGNTVWIKNGSYTLGAAMTFSNGSGTSSVFVKGYNANRGDNPTGATRPLINTGANVFTTGTISEFSYLSIMGNGTSTINVGARTRIIFVKAVNNSTTASRNAFLTGAEVDYFGVEAISYRGNAINGSTNGFALSGSYLHDSDIGIATAATASSLSVTDTIFDGMVTAGVSNTASNTTNCHFNGNTFYGGVSNPTGIGISINTGSTAYRMRNNIFYGLATGISSADSNQTINIEDYNTFNNCTTARTNIPTGAHSITLSPGFTNVAQVTGTTGVVSSSTITDSGANFSNVVDNQDFLYLISGAGATVGQYLITSHTTTSVTLNSSPGGNGTNIHYQVTTGHNFAVGTNMQTAGYPGTFPEGLTIGYLDLGAAQRQERASTDPGVANVRLGTTYEINNSNLTGTLNLPSIANVLSGVTFDNGNQTGTLAIPTAAQNAVAVWNETTSSHTTVGTFGYLTQQLLTLAQFLGLK